MKMYFAGISGNKKRLHYLKDNGAKRLMLTYADMKFYNKQMPRFKEMGFDIMMDSGAFSLWKRGFQIDILNYCVDLEKHGIKNYIVLDKIGDHKETMKNQKIMEDLGMKPVPVYHFGSPIRDLEEICEEYDYVCLGGSVGQKTPARIKFFSEVFARFPNHKFHGLGLTSVTIVRMFPFYSIDSTTWLMAEKVNRIFDNYGKRIIPDISMTPEEKFKNTISYFSKLDSAS